jgi:hypothetical protein
VTATTVLNRVIPGRKRRKEAQEEHKWASALDLSLNHPYYCNICGELIDNGKICLLCSFTCHQSCFDKIPFWECKRESIIREEKMKHRYLIFDVLFLVVSFFSL